MNHLAQASLAIPISSDCLQKIARHALSSPLDSGLFPFASLLFEMMFVLQSECFSLLKNQSAIYGPILVYVSVEISNLLLDNFLVYYIICVPIR